MVYYRSPKEKLFTSIPIIKVSIGLFILLLMYFVVKFFVSSNSSPSCTDRSNQEYEYTEMRHMDVEGSDLLHIHASDINIVRRVCNLLDDCLAFNSNGWLKSSSLSQASSQADLYVKKDPLLVQKDSNSASDYMQMLSTMKIFVYNTRIGVNHRPRRIGGYSVERQFVEALLKSPFITQNGNKATFFLIPIRCSSYILDATSEEDGISEAKRIIGKIVDEIKATHPYWNRSAGSDHFYICAHDVGAAVGDQILKNAIALVNTADYDDPYYIPHKDISLPPSTSPGMSRLVSLKGGSLYGFRSKNILALYVGDTESGRVRPTVWNKWSNNNDFVMVDHRISTASYVEYLKRSIYCLVIRGREAWSPRLVEVIFAGCIPVIISDHYHLPLQGVVDWNEFSVIIPESEVSQLKTVLQRITSTRLSEMQAKLQEVYQHFVWNSSPRLKDAFYSVMLQLWQRRHVLRYVSAL